MKIEQGWTQFAICWWRWTSVNWRVQDTYLTVSIIKMKRRRARSLRHSWASWFYCIVITVVAAVVSRMLSITTE